MPLGWCCKQAGGGLRQGCGGHTACFYFWCEVTKWWHRTGHGMSLTCACWAAWTELTRFVFESVSLCVSGDGLGKTHSERLCCVFTCLENLNVLTGTVLLITPEPSTSTCSAESTKESQGSWQYVSELLKETVIFIILLDLSGYCNELCRDLASFSSAFTFLNQLTLSYILPEYWYLILYSDFGDTLF